MNYSLALQWSLDETSDHFLRVGRDVVRAATTDNVQALALLACERFGATLAICPVTRLRIEKHIRSQTSSTTIKFLKATVGFSNGGSILELSKSVAGVNFLALAATLVSVTDTFQAATAIEMMILDSAADKTLVPTVYHLKDLLDVLEPRLNRVGFLTDVLAWKDWWSRQGDSSYEIQGRMREEGSQLPSAQSIMHIVAALRDISRIGDAKSINITIVEAVPWLIAFLRWCLGEPPTICTSDGQYLLDQPNFPVKITYAMEVTTVNPAGDTRHHETQIDILNTFDNFTKVITTEPRTWRNAYITGMIDIPSHANSVIRLARMEADLEYRCLLHALPFALDHVRNNWHLHLQFQERRHYNNLGSDSNDGLRPGGPIAFPKDTVIAEVAKRYLSLPEPLQLEHLQRDCLIRDLPLLRRCAELPDGTTSPRAMDLIVRSISEITADILVLSLFNGCLDTLLVYHDAGDMMRGSKGFAFWINSMLSGRQNDGAQGRHTCGVEVVLEWVFGLVQHNVGQSLKERNWACSSSHGQVVFPKVFEDRIMRINGYLELFSLPGVLSLPESGSKTFPLVRAVETVVVMDSDEPPALLEPLSRNLNIYPQEQLLWRIQTHSDHMTVGMGWSKNGSLVNAFELLKNLESAVFANPCPHDQTEFSDHSLKFLRNFKLMDPCNTILKPLQDEFRRERNGIMMTSLYTYPVAGNQGLRMLALATTRIGRNGVSAVVNNGACLDCLLKQCHVADRELLIL